MLDTSFFHDVRVERHLKCDVMPWLLEKTEDLVASMAQYSDYSIKKSLMDHADETAKKHADKVAEHKNRLKMAKEAAEQAEKERIEGKQRRKAEREAAHKAE